MSKIVIGNLLKSGIDRTKMISLGFSAQKYDDVLRGKSSYKLNDLVMISEKFQLSLDYLVYGTEKSTSQNEVLSEDKIRLLDMYDILTDMEKGEILGELKMKTANRQKKENEEIA